MVLKWILTDEPDREEALLLRQRHIRDEDPIAAPDLLLYEAANVLAMKGDDPQWVLQGFQDLYSVGLYLHPFDLPEFSKTVELAFRYKITAYDACYLALAQALRCRFVTADERLLARLKGVPHVLPLTDTSL